MKNIKSSQKDCA